MGGKAVWKKKNHEDEVDGKRNRKAGPKKGQQNLGRVKEQRGKTGPGPRAQDQTGKISGDIFKGITALMGQCWGILTKTWTLGAPATCLV